MGSLLGKKPKTPKPDPTVIAAQRRQNADLNRRENEEQKELGARNRLLRARQMGRGETLFAVQEAGGPAKTLGG